MGNARGQDGSQAKELRGSSKAASMRLAVGRSPFTSSGFVVGSYSTIDFLVNNDGEGGCTEGLSVMVCHGRTPA